MLPFLLLVAVAAALMGMLNALGHFFLPALSPATFNLASIGLVIALVPIADSLGLHPIVIVAIATIVGGLAQVAIQWPPLLREGFRYQPRLDLRDEGLRRVLLLMGPGTIGMAATQINVFVNTVLATGQGTGAVSWLDYAFRLMYLPIGLFGVSVATASTPAIARLVAKADFGQVRATIAHAISLMMLLNVPATVGLIVLAEPIIRVIFEHGSFTAADTAATAGALRFYALGLLGYSVVRIVSPAFYALGRSRTPVMISTGSVLVNVALNLALVRVMGYRGLALGTSLTALLNAATQIALLRREIGGVEGRRIADSFVRIALAAAAMGVAAFGADWLLLRWLPGDTVVLQALRLAWSIGLALVVLVAAAWALAIPELGEARAMVLRRLGRRA
jgi:putative peptidoglycan lipid II flippase